jgi:hypothetical protein
MSKRDTNTDSTPKKRARSKKELFLDAFAEHANVMLAAREAGIHRSTVYVWLEQDEEFSLAYNQAKENAKDVIRAEIKRRAVDGWDEEVYQLGHFAGKVHKYSDTLLIFQAKMLMPEYRDKSQLDVNNITPNTPGTIPINTKDLTSEELALLKQIALRQKAQQGES